MHSLILPSFINGQDEDLNRNQFNATLMNIMAASNASFCDCQSHPLKRYFGDLYEHARFSIGKSIEKYQRGISTALRPTQRFLRYVEQTPYADLLQERAEVPEGLAVPYLQYLDVLIKAQERANGIVANVIQPFSKYVAKMVTDEAFRNGVRHSIKEFTDMEATSKIATEEIGKCFKTNSYASDVAFSKVVARNGDWPIVFQKTEELKKISDKYDPKEVTRALNGLYEVVDKLIEVIQVDGMSKAEMEATKTLSAGMYSVAREVEFSASVLFRSQVLIQAINTTISSFEKKKKL